MSSGPPDSERLTAYHEAGHALMAELCGQQITHVEIVGDSEHAGSTEALRFHADSDEGSSPRASLEDIECRLRCVLAGVVAESMVSGRPRSDDTSGDLDAAVRLAMKLGDDCEDVLPLLEDVGAELEAELERRWAAVELLAAGLLEHKRLSGSEVRRILELTAAG
jgi:hypothetical protein